MSLQIPKIDRELFPRTSIESVICQVRFDDILDLENNAPADFHRTINSRFPRVEEGGVLQLRQGSPVTKRMWNFQSTDRQSSCNLRSDALTFQTSDYSNFEDLSKLLELGFNALSSIYSRKHVKRIGLRYVNAVIRTCAPGERINWKGWVNEELLPPLSFELGAADLGASHQSFNLTHPDGGTWVLQANISRGAFASKPAESFRLDFDQFVEEETPIANALSIIANYNSWAYRVFRWSIGEKLVDCISSSSEPPEGVHLGATNETP